MVALISKSDPYTIPAFAGHNYIDRGSRSLRTPRLTAGENTAVFIVAGQSNAANCLDSSYSANNASKIDNFNLFDGGVYAASDPLLGCTIDSAGLGNLFFRFSDKLITAGSYDRVILAPVAVGGTLVQHWEQAAPLNLRPIVAARRLASVGLPVTAFIWMQGETDAANGTSQSSYADSLSGVISSVRGEGFSQPWLIGKCTYNSGNTSSTIRSAQAAVVNGTDIFAGADSDTLTGTSVNRQADNTHFKAAGGDAAASLWRDAVIAAL